MKQLFWFIVAASTPAIPIYLVHYVSERVGFVVAYILISAVLYRIYLLSLSHKDDGSHKDPQDLT